MQGRGELQRLHALQPVPVVIDFKAGAAQAVASRDAVRAALRQKPAPAEPPAVPIVTVASGADRAGSGAPRPGCRPRRRRCAAGQADPVARALAAPALIAPDGAVGERGRQVLAGASARSGRLAHRHRRRARRPRSRRAVATGVNESELTLDVALRLQQAAREAAGRRSRDDPRHRRLHSARGAHGDRQPRRRGPLPLDSRQRQPQPEGARQSRPTS